MYQFHENISQVHHDSVVSGYMSIIYFLDVTWSADFSSNPSKLVLKVPTMEMVEAEFAKDGVTPEFLETIMRVFHNSECKALQYLKSLYVFWNPMFTGNMYYLINLKAFVGIVSAIFSGALIGC